MVVDFMNKREYLAIFRAQPFIAIKSKSLSEHFNEGITKMRKVTNSTLFCIVHFTKALTVLSSRKCSINAPAKCKTFVYVLMEILPPIK